VERATIVLAAAQGLPNAVIAVMLGIGVDGVDTVHKWRGRWFAAPGVASLGDAKRSGRPPQFTPVQVAQVKAVACTPPTACGVPLSRWSCPELASHAVANGICASISQATVRRWLSEDALKRWQAPVVDLHLRSPLRLYARVWEGKPLGDNDFVIAPRSR
jgi:Homeodomain-like domain